MFYKKILSTLTTFIMYLGHKQFVSHAKWLEPLGVHLSDHIGPCNRVNYMSIIESVIIAKEPSVTLKRMGDHKVLDLWSKDQN